MASGAHSAGGFKKRPRPAEQHIEPPDASAPKRHQPSYTSLVDNETTAITTSHADYEGHASSYSISQRHASQALHREQGAAATPPLTGTEQDPFEISSSPPAISEFESHHHTDTSIKLALDNAVGPNPPGEVAPPSEPILVPEQAELVDLIVNHGRNVFYTGSAGCGKSTVLKAFVKQLRDRGRRVDIIAPTGRAALEVNGQTTWSYAGWRPPLNKPIHVLKKGAHGKHVRRRLMDTDILVIDEISMVENHHFERLNAIMKEARMQPGPFGNVQLIVTGDFCQLPPVTPFQHCYDCGRELMRNKEGTEYTCRTHGTFYDIDKWAFRSKAWEECHFKHVNLVNIHRQKDMRFINILEKLRMGRTILPIEKDLLLQRKDDTLRNAVQLFPTRREVKMVNDGMFSKLPTTARLYKCQDHFRWEKDKHRNLERKQDRGPDGSLVALGDHRYESQLRLKKGMLVVLLQNLDINAGLVNGSQGTIQGFEEYDASKMPKAAQNGRNPEPPMSMNTPILTGDHAMYRQHQIQKFVDQAEYKAWPIVNFLNGARQTIYANCTINELGEDEPHSLLSRTQIPLMAAWAMTTHKSQGMTLSRVEVNLSKAFEEGQAYVALSRAKSLEGLKVTSLPNSAMGSGNPQVRQFLREKFGIA